MTLHQITESELKSILKMLKSSDSEVIQTAIACLNTFDGTGLKQTQHALFFKVMWYFDPTNFAGISIPTYTSYKDGRLLKIIKEGKDQ